jgi:hypothetical protein
MASAQSAERNRRLQADMQGVSLVARHAEAGAARGFAVEQADRAHARQREDYNLRREDMLEDRDAAAVEARFVEAGRREAGREDIEWGISARQRAEHNKLNEAYDEAKESGLYSEEELQDMRKQIIAKQAGIQPMPRMKEPSPYPEGQGVGEQWSSRGFVMTRDPDGSERKIGDDRSVPTFKDIGDLWGQASKTLQQVVTDPKTGAETIKQPSPEEIEAWVERAIGLRNKFAGGPAGGQPGPAGGDDGMRDQRSAYLDAVEARRGDMSAFVDEVQSDIEMMRTPEYQDYMREFGRASSGKGLLNLKGVGGREGKKLDALWSKVGGASPEEAPHRVGASPSPVGPKVGAVVDGHEFLGGDPNSRDSWRKL